jgi:predicted nucleic acid-binding protein
VKWLLDTNVISERVARRPDHNVIEWIAERRPEQLAISAVTAAELRAGALSASEPRRSELLDWIEREIDVIFASRTLPITIDILMDWLHLARRFALSRKSNSGPDTLIAATARVHGLIVVTRNVRDFAGTGVTLYNPWTDKTTQMESL